MDKTLNSLLSALGLYNFIRSFEGAHIREGGLYPGGGLITGIKKEPFWNALT